MNRKKSEKSEKKYIYVYFIAQSCDCVLKSEFKIVSLDQLNNKNKINTLKFSNMMSKIELVDEINQVKI